jgi:hypothetical protein
MLLAITGRYRHKKTRKLLIYIVFRVSVGFLKTLLWWRRRELNLSVKSLNSILNYE